MNHIKNIRQAVADYMGSEGCSCCSDRKAHEQHKALLAKLLRVPKYSDGSGYDFERFRSDRATANGSSAGAVHGD